MNASFSSSSSDSTASDEPTSLKTFGGISGHDLIAEFPLSETADSLVVKVGETAIQHLNRQMVMTCLQIAEDRDKLALVFAVSVSNKDHQAFSRLFRVLDAKAVAMADKG